MNNPKKAFYLLIAAFFLVGAGIIAMLYFSKNFLSVSEEELVQAKLEIAKQEETERIYRENINNLEEFSKVATILEEVIPQEKDQARAVREIDFIAKQNGLAINTLSFPSSDLNKPSPVGTGTAAEPTNTAVSQAKPVAGLPGVLGVNINIELRSADNTSISTDQLLGMLRDLENNRRNMRVTSINFNAGGETVDMQIIIFIKP